MSNKLFNVNNRHRPGRHPTNHPPAPRHPNAQPSHPQHRQNNDEPEIRAPGTARLPDFLRTIYKPVRRDVQRMKVLLTSDKIVTLDRLEEIARLERGWTPADKSINGKGGLRRAVWCHLLPNPAVHFDECVKRLPIIAECPEARDYFLRTARAQHEPREGPCTNRCPLCQSQLLGFPMADHSRDDCPFRVLMYEDRVTFMANNTLAFCPRCNRRSPYHTECDARHMYCTKCKERGHTATLAFCYNTMGEPTAEAEEYVLSIVHAARVDMMYQIRRIMNDGLPGERLKYRLYCDHPHDQEYRKLAKYKTITGWGPFLDPNQNFVPLPENLYSNSLIGDPVDYPALTPVELTSDHVLKIFDIDPESNHLLTLMADKVDALKAGADPDYLDLGELYAVSSNHVRLSQIRRETTEETHPNAGRYHPGNTHPQPSKSSTSTISGSQSGQKPLMKPSKSTLREPVHSSQYDNVDWTKPQHPIPNWAQHEEDYDSSQSVDQPASSYRSESYAGSSSNKSFGAMPSTSRQGLSKDYKANNRGNQTLPVQRGNSSHSSSKNSQSTLHQQAPVHSKRQARQAPLTGASQTDDSSTTPDAIRENTTEKLLSRRVHTLCYQSLPVANKPARVQFQGEAYNKVKLVPIPNCKAALIERIRTLQFLLTGDYETDDFTLCEPKHLLQYATLLSDLAATLEKLPMHIVQLERRSDEAVTLKFLTGDDVIQIPGYTLSSHPTVLATLNEVLQQNGQFWVEPYERFLSYGKPERRAWIKPQDERTEASGLKAVEMAHAERHRVETFKPERYSITSVYEHPQDLLRELISFRPPIGVMEAMRMRIVYTLKLLTGKSTHTLPPTVDPELSILTEYNHLLVGAARCVNQLRKHKRTVKVTPTSCQTELANIASARHDLPIPEWSLFRITATEKWYAWLDTVWTSLVDIVTETPCQCHKHNDQQ